MACPTPIGFFRTYSISYGAGGAINYRGDGKTYDSITTSSKSQSQCRYLPGEPGNYFSCPTKDNGSMSMSKSGGSLSTSYTYELDIYGNILTKRSDSGSGSSSSNGNGGGANGAGGKLGAALFCSNGSTTSTATSNVSLKGSYKDIGSCGGKEYNIKSTGRSEGMQSTSGSGYQASCGNPNISGADCSMNGVVTPINDNYPSGGPCSSTNGYADTEDVPACGGVVGGYHSGFNIVETPTSTSGSYTEENDDCTSNSSYNQTVSQPSTVDQRKALAIASVTTRLTRADKNLPYQKCVPNTCGDGSPLACYYGGTFDNPSNLGTNDSLSSEVIGYMFRPGSYANGALNLGYEDLKVKMYFYYIPCDRDEYGELHAREYIEGCNCGQTTPITSTAPAKETSFTIGPKDNLMTTYSPDGKTITSQSIIGKSGTMFKTSDATADTSVQICWVYEK